MLNQLFGDVLGLVMLFSQYLDAGLLFLWKRNARKMVMVLFGSKSPEAEANLWNLMLDFDGSGVWYAHSTDISGILRSQYAIPKTFWTISIPEWCFASWNR
jgi:hypothetical protein